MDTLTQVERLIELAIIQRSELRRLVEELPQLKAHLSEEIERTFEETEPQLRAELEEWTTKQTADKTAALGVALEAKIADLAKSLEVSTQARYNAIIAEREENARLAAQAEAKIAEHAASLPSAVKDIVTAELARFPRAGEIDQLRKEFAEPKSLNPRGKWVAGETYNKLDLVTINGDSYVSNIDGNTEKPSRSAGNWTLNAARGNSGGGGGITALNDLLGNPSAGDIVGSEGNNYVRKTLTAGTGITITDDPSTITIDASGAQELLTATVKNAESVAITRGQVVYLFSATGGFPSVKLAYNTSDATSAKTFGVVSDVSIAPNGTGTITCVGVVSNLNLGAYNDGDTVYLGATPGSFTATKPYAPNHLVYVGIIERANAGNGELYVRVQNGYELDEIHDVQINSPLLAGQTLIYDATTDLWKNARLTAGVGVSISNGDSAITISADGGVNYQGTWNASTNTPTLTSSVGTKGFYYVVSVAGSTNLNGVTDWKVGDWAIFNGTAWEKVDTTDQVSSVFGRTGAVVGVSTDYSSVGITNTAIGASNPSTGAFTTLSASTSLTSPDITLGASGPSVKSTLSARAPRQGLVFDGTSQATVANGQVIGTRDFTIAAWVLRSGSNLSVPIWGNAGSIGCAIRASTITLDKPGTGTVVTWNYTVASDKFVFVTIRRSGTTATAYVDGVSIGDVSSVSTDFTTVFSTVGLTTFSIGSIIGPYIYNRALSASEVVALYEAGAPAGADYNSASNTAINTSTVSSQFGGSGTLSSASATGFNLVWTSGNTSYIATQPNLVGGGYVGRKFRYSFTITVNSGTGPRFEFWRANATGNAVILNSLTSGTYSGEYTFGDNQASFFAFVSAAAVNYTVSNLSITALGLLLAPDAAQAGGGLVWYDTSGNAANITLPASGVTWNVPTSGKMATSLNVNAAASLFASTSNSTSISDVDTTAAFITKGSGTPRLYFGNENAANRPFLQAGVGGGSLFMCIQPYGGNALFGSLTDSGNGRIQLAAGAADKTSGIGLGADISIYRRAQGVAVIDAVGLTASEFNLRENGTTRFFIATAATTGTTMGAVAGSLVLKSADTTALTLDSSQNAIFAGSTGVQLKNDSFLYFGSTVRTAVKGNSTGSLELYANNNLSLTLDSSANATFAGKITANGAGSTFKGTATNDSAAAGYVGEFVSSIVASGSAVSLTTNTITNVTSISLTAGDWDVFGAVDFIPEAATVRTRSIGAVSTTSASLPATYYRNTLTLGTTDANAETYGGPTPVQRISISSTTTVYLVAFATFSGGTQTAHGYIQARRVR